MCNLPGPFSSSVMMDWCQLRGLGPRSLPLSHPERVRQHDAKLKTRELNASQVSGHAKMPCPCMNCKGNYHTTRKTALTHLSKWGRYPACRIWNGDGGDSSDEEWAAGYMQQMGPDAIRADNQHRAGYSDQIEIHHGEDAKGVEENQPTLGDAHMEEGNGQQDVQNLLEEDALDIPDDTDSDEDLTPDPFDLDSVLDSGPIEEDDSLNIPVGVEGGDLLADILEKATRPMFAGSKIDCLSFVLLFLTACHNHSLSNKGVEEVLGLINKYCLPSEHTVPKNLWAAKKMLRSLGLDYERIPVCDAGCMLFRGKNADIEACTICNKPRMRKVGKSMQPVKILHYFPIIPRLKRLYATRGTSSLMTWHSENKSTDGMVRHPADSKAWKHVDTQVDPGFAEEARNVRLGLALDGVNPFSQNSTVWSTWPVLLLNYNLPLGLPLKSSLSCCPWLSLEKRV